MFQNIILSDGFVFSINSKIGECEYIFCSMIDIGQEVLPQQ